MYNLENICLFFLGMQALGVQIDPAGTLSINKKTRDKSKETNKKNWWPDRKGPSFTLRHYAIFWMFTTTSSSQLIYPICSILESSVFFVFYLSQENETICFNKEEAKLWILVHILLYVAVCHPVNDLTFTRIYCCCLLVCDGLRESSVKFILKSKQAHTNSNQTTRRWLNNNEMNAIFSIVSVQMSWFIQISLITSQVKFVANLSVLYMNLLCQNYSLPNILNTNNGICVYTRKKLTEEKGKKLTRIQD